MSEMDAPRPLGLTAIGIYWYDFTAVSDCHSTMTAIGEPPCCNLF